jgi:hypothetical protein
MERIVKGYGVRFSTGFCTRGCHWIPRMFASSSYMRVTNGHSSREPSALTVALINYVETLKAVRRTSTVVGEYIGALDQMTPGELERYGACFFD